MGQLGVFEPNSAQFPSANFPERVTFHATERRAVLYYDAAVEQTAAWVVVAPEDLTGPLTVKIKGIARTATAGGFAFDVSVEAMGPTATINRLTTVSYDSVNTGVQDPVPATNGFPWEIEIQLDNDDGIAAGDIVRIKNTRQVDHADDDASGDAGVETIAIRDAA